MPRTNTTVGNVGSDAPSIGYRPEDRARYNLLLSYLNVSKRVLAKRWELGLSQEALAKIAGTKQAKISEIELMKGNPRFDTLDRIARALNLTIDLVPPSGRFTTKPTVSSIPTRAEVQVRGELVGAGAIGSSGSVFIAGRLAITTLTVPT
jgi:transcriptional regulator with XRE-family HTH domain